MKLIQVVVKKIQQAASSNGLIASVAQVGLSFATRFSLVAGEVKTGVKVEQSPSTFRGAPVNVGVQSTLLGASGQAVQDSKPGIAVSSSPSSLDPAGNQVRPGLAIVQSLREFFASSVRKNVGFAMSLLGATGAAAQEPNSVGLALSTCISEFNTPKIPAIDIKAVLISGSRRVGGNAVVETAVGGRTDWASDANAIDGTDGRSNGVNATIVGNTLAVRGGQLELAFADHLNKDRLRITNAKLHFFGSVTGASLNNADVQLRWDSGTGAFVTLETITGDANFAVTPKTHDITTSFNSWAGYNALRAAVSMAAAALETYTANLDAIEAEITFEYKYVEDASGNGRDGAVLGRTIPTAIASTSGFGSRIDFDGVDRDDASSGVVSPPVPAAAAAWTLECRFRKDRSATEIFASWSDWGGTNDAIQLTLAAGNIVQAQVFKAGTFTGALSSGAIANGEHSARVSWDGTTVYLFVNGVLQSSAALSNAQVPTNPMKVWAGRVNWYAGAAAAFPYAFDGAVDELRVSNICRSTATYVVDVAPFATDANTLLLWHMDGILP